MKRLQKVLNIWQNLDETYNNMQITDPTLTKEEFLKKLLSFDKAKDSPVQLKAMLSREIESYTAEEYADYESLIEVLDATYSKLLKNHSEVINLDEFVYSNICKAFDINDYDVLGQHKKQTNIKEMLDAGYLLDTIVEVDNEIKSFMVGNNQKDYVAIKSMIDAMIFLQQDAGRLKDNDFLMKVYYVLGNYIMKNNMIFPTVFLGPSLFELKGKEIKAGAVTIPVTKRNLTIKEDVSITTLKKEELRIKHLEYYNKKMDFGFGNMQINCMR